MPIRSRVRFEVLKRDGFTCQYCGRRPPEVALHVDHIDPQSKGGGDELDNLITSCGQCNLGKSDRPLMQVTPCAYCNEEKAGLFFEVPDVELGRSVGEVQTKLVCTECIRTAVWELGYGIAPEILRCCGCGHFFRLLEPYVKTPSSVHQGWFAWVCPPCHELEPPIGVYRGPQVAFCSEGP